MASRRDSTEQPVRAIGQSTELTALRRDSTEQPVRAIGQSTEAHGITQGLNRTVCESNRPEHRSSMQQENSRQGRAQSMEKSKAPKGFRHGHHLLYRCLIMPHHAPPAYLCWMMPHHAPPAY
eukprot:1157761-Pelagomonas_calceolata.AAC.3